MSGREKQMHDLAVSFESLLAGMRLNAMSGAPVATTFVEGWYIAWKKLHYFDTAYSTLCGRALSMPVLMFMDLRPNCKSCWRIRKTEERDKQ